MFSSGIVRRGVLVVLLAGFCLGLGGCKELGMLATVILQMLGYPPASDDGTTNGDFVVEESDELPAEEAPPGTVLGLELVLPVSSGFGDALAINQHCIAVGCPRRSATGGGVYVYGPAGDGPASQVTLPMVDGDDDFGCSLACDGAHVVVGARSYGPDAVGAAFVYSPNWLTWPSVLEADDPTAGSGFGTSVAIEGDVVVVGAPSHPGSTVGEGAAYVFRKLGLFWLQEAKLVAGNPSANAEFGRVVDIEGETIVIGAPGGKDDGGFPTGAVHVFQAVEGSWSSANQRRLHAPDGYLLSGFGTALDLEGDTLAVGAPGWTQHRGCGYVYERTGGTWSEGERLLPHDTGDIQEFGAAVALDGDLLAFGAPADGEQHDRAGAVYLFSRASGDWLETAKPTPAADLTYTALGAALDIHDGTVVASAATSTRGVVFILRESAGKALAAAKDPAAVNEYLAFRAHEDAPGPGSGRIVVPRELRAPFRAEITAGVFDPDQDADLAGAELSFGVEVPRADPRTFIAVAGTVTETGFDLTVVTEEGASGGPVSLGATLLDLAVEHDGTDLILLARAHGGGTFTEVGRVAAPPATTLFPFLGLAEVPAGGVMGFDDPKLVANAPAEPGSAAGVVDLLYQAMELEIAATSDLKALTGDPDAALAECAGKLDQAYADVMALREAKKADRGLRKATKQIKRAGKKVAKSRKLLSRERPAKKVVKQIESAMKAEVKAIAALSTVG